MSGREYPTRPLVGVGVVVLRPATDGPAVLLVQRGKPPGLGAWSLPGGAQRLGERAEEAARRELAEETGLAVGPLTLITHVDSIHTDGSGRIQFHYTILDFAGVSEAGTPVAGDDARQCRFVPASELAAYALTAEAERVIAQARALLAL